jgi:hypothetical protein
MTVSKEVADTVARIRAQQDYIKADKEADKLRDKQLADALAARKDAEDKMADLQAKLDAIPVRQELSQEDKDALQHAFDEANDAQTSAGEALDTAKETHDDLKDAVPANANSPSSGQLDGLQPSPAPAKVEAEEIPTDPEGERPDPLPGTARGDGAPLMPNMAFDPDPTGSRGKGDAGQPNQPAAIETAGGFVVSGGGTTQRAPGSMPDSPSSSQVVPLDPDAKAPANNADLLKSGLGDSSQNALLGNDGQPISQGPGIVKEPTDAEREAAQKQQDALNAEKAAREENPLNLAPAGTPQAGSPDAEKASREAALDAQRKAQDDAKKQSDDEKARNSDQKGVADDGSSKPTSDFPDEKVANPS